MNAKKPLTISDLFSKTSKPKIDKQAKKAARKANKSKKPDDAVDMETKKQGFGANSAANSVDSKKATGFGQSLDDRNQDGKSSGDERAAGAGGNAEKNDAKKDDAKKDDAKRAARFAARSVMYQHDENKNKRLERSEWKKLKGDPSKADRNKDNVLTLAELTDHLAGYGSREEKPRPNYRVKREQKRKAKSGVRTTYRFLTPHERLPEGLPDWFAERDTNGDGQLSLREYAPSLTRAKYEKFSQLDQNNDGLLVAKEYLVATEQ
jgi:hypothetical protein